MKGKHRTKLHLNFKTKLVLMISLFNISLVLCVSFFNYLWHSQQLTRQTINQTQQIIEQTGVNIDNYIDELYRLTLSPYYNDEIMEEIASSPRTPEEILTKKRTIETFLSSVMTLPRDEVLRVYILTDDDIYSYTRTPYQMEDYDSYKEAAWYKEALSTNNPIYIPIHSEKAFGERRTQIFSVARRLRSKENNNYILGVIKVDANYTGIKSICDKVKLENQGALFVINENEEVVYAKNDLADSSLLYELSLQTRNGDFSCYINREKYIVNVTTLQESGLRIIAIHSYNNLTSRAKANLSRTVFLAFICIVASIGIFILFIRRFLHPLYHIIDSMKIVQTGDLTVQVPIEQNDEIGYLASSFNTMTSNLKNVIDRNSELIKKVYEARYLHKVSQYDALCSQIKPHFLYNTLNTISLLIKCGESRDAILCIEDLSRFLRGIMNTDKEIPLKEELSLVSSYLNLQKIRYGDRLSYDLKIEKNTEPVLIPALSLQPLVENTIKHCCEASRTPVAITITSVIQKDQLRIRVADNGPGIPEAILQRLITGLDKEGEENNLEASIGLINVHRRLRLRVGPASGLQITSCAEGTSVTLVIPLLISKEEGILCTEHLL